MSASVARLAIVAMVALACLVGRASAYATAFKQCADSNCLACQEQLLDLDSCQTIASGPFGTGSSFRLSCASQSASASWTGSVFAGSSCQVGVQAFSGVDASSCIAIPGTPFYFKLDCGGVPTVPPTTTAPTVAPTVAPGLDCSSRTALAYSGAGCTGSPDTLKGASGSCQALGSYFARLTCDTTSSDSTWNVGIYFAAGCSGSPALSKSGAGTACTTFNAIISTYYISIDCGLPAACSALPASSGSDVVVVSSSAPALTPAAASSAVAVVDASTGGAAPAANCVQRTVSAFSAAGCTGTPDVLKGESGACQSLSSYYARLTCASASSSSAWTVDVFLAAGCSGSPTLTQSGSGTSCTTFNALITTYYLQVDCAATCPDVTVLSSSAAVLPTSLPTTSTGTAVVPTTSPTTAPLDCQTRTARAYSEVGCTGTAEVVTGASGTCTGLGDYYVKLTCANALSSSPWTVQGYTAPGCSGAALLTQTGTGTTCTLLNAIIKTYYISVDCGLPARCTPEGNLGGSAGPLTPPSATSSTGVAVTPRSSTGRTTNTQASEGSYLSAALVTLPVAAVLAMLVSKLVV